jgi:hypothetical protein
MVCRKIEQESPDQGRFVQDGEASPGQYARMDSRRTQLGPAPFEEAAHLPFSLISPLAHPLYGVSPIGETSPVCRSLTGHFSATYDWSWDCLTCVVVSLQERIDAENSEDSERGSRLRGERSHGRRKCTRVDNTTWIRTERSPHCHGLKGSYSRGSRRGRFSRTLRSRQHHAQELSAIHPRVDHERTTRALAVHRSNKCGRPHGHRSREIEIEGRVQEEFESRQ